MSIARTNSRLDAMSDCFEVLTLSPPDWPVMVTAAIAGDKARAAWPAFPEAATLRHERLGHGRGGDAASARRSAIGELVEIASCCDWGDLAVRWHSPGAVGDDGWGPARLNGFSRVQHADRDAWNHRLAGLDWIPPAADPGVEIEWIPADEATTGRTILVPADAVVIGRREAGDPAAVSVADTSGCAAGPTCAAAQASALLELAERDATGRWWYGRRPCPVLRGGVSVLAQEIEHFLERLGRSLWLLDITSDLGIPTIAALAADANGSHVSAGFAARLHRHDAINAALGELMQMDLKIAISRKHGQDLADLETWFGDVGMADVPAGPDQTVQGVLAADDGAPEATPERQIAFCLDRLDRAGCTVAFVDFTRPEFGVPVCRAVSPDLCHWKPRFGRDRLAEEGSELHPKLLRV